MPPRKKMYLHIGPPKTASSHLQRAFVTNREQLKKFGVIYPKLGQGFTAIEFKDAYTHDDLILFLKNQVDDERYSTLPPSRFSEQDLVTFLASAQTVLLSSENFCWCFDPCLEVLTRYLDDYEVHVVYFLRSWTEILPARWGELVKLGFICPLPDFVNFSLEPDYPAGITRRHLEAGNNLNPCVVLDCFARHFDKANFHIVNYNTLVQHGIDLLDFFLTEILHIENSEGFIHSPKTNPSFPPEMTETLRVINQMFFSERYARADWLQYEFHDLEINQAIAQHRRVTEPFQSGAIRMSERMREFLGEHRLEFMFDTEHASVRAFEQEIVEKYGHRILGGTMPPGEPLSFKDSPSPSATYISNNVWQHPVFLADVLDLYSRLRPSNPRKAAAKKLKRFVQRGLQVLGGSG